jgi:glutamate racemase
LFVPLAEEGWADHKIACMAAEEYLRPLLEHNIDTLVLGCTHYPLLKRTLQNVAGDGVTLIDSAEETAKTVAGLLQRQRLGRRIPSAAAPRYFVTDIPDRFQRVGGAFLGGVLDNVATISLD